MDALSRPLSRAGYLAWGVGLSVLKVAVDFGIATLFHHPYSLLFYVSPVDAPLFHPGQDLAYWGTLAVTTVPFTAVGVGLTVRRLRDIGMSASYALLFFTPFANLLFFLAMAVAPSRGRAPELPPQPMYREPGREIALAAPARSRGTSIWMSAALGTVLALGTMAVSVGLLGSYGVALMIGSPVIAGFSTGAFYGRLQPDGRFREAALATTLATVFAVAGLIFAAMEGAVCLVMAMPLFVLPSYLGAFIGFSASKSMPRKNLDAALLGAVLLLPLLFVGEHLSPLPALAAEPILTETVIDAPPERVWPLVAEVAEMETPAHLPFSAGIAYPIRATLDAPRVGAVRRCEFSTGIALETVERWDPPRELVFHIDTQPDPMVEATLWRGPRQPHLDGYVRNQRGQFVLERLPGDRTRLVARSWVDVRITPESYWRLWSDGVVHAIHRRVMDHAKTRAEAGASKPLAAVTGPGARRSGS